MVGDELRFDSVCIAELSLSEERMKDTSASDSFHSSGNMKRKKTISFD